MPGEQELLDRILNILKFKSKGMTITEIAHHTSIHRNSIAKYLQVLLASGKVDEHLVGNAKVYTISRRLPINKILECSPDLILLLDEEGQIIQVNDKYLQYFNLDEDEVLKKQIDDPGLPVISNKMLAPLLKSAIENGEKCCKEIVHTSEGMNYNFYLRCLPSILEGGEHGLIVILTDFTEEKRMRDALIENEEKFQNIFNNANDAIFLYEITEDKRIGRLLEVNDTACKKLHYSREEFFQTKFTNIFHGANGSDGTIEPNLAENYHSIYEGILIRKDGISFPVEANAHVFHLKDRLVVLYINRDISERKKAETCLTISENRYRDIVEGQQELICRMSSYHSVNYVNEAFCSHFSVPKEMAIGKTLETLDIHPEDVELVRRSVELADKDKVSQIVEFRTHHIRGTPRWIEGSISPILDANGAIFEFQFVGRDCTDAKMAKEALKRNEENTRFLLNSINDNSLLIDLDGRILSLNKSSCEYIRDFSGDDTLSMETIPGRSIYDFFPADLAGTIRNIASEMVSSKHSDSFVNEFNGRIFDISFSPIVNFGGEVEKIAVVKKDVTERKEYESDLTTTISRLTDIIDFLPEATFVINCDSEVVAWNKAMEDLTGIPKEEILGRGDHSYSVPFYGTTRPMLIDYVISHEMGHSMSSGSFWKEGHSLNAEIWSSRLNKGDGAYLWVKATGLYDEGGNLIGAIESIHDVTQRKRMEDDLLKSEEKYRDLVEKTYAIVLQMDLAGTIIFVNEVGERLMGYQKGELTGQSAVDTILSGRAEDAPVFWERPDGRIADMAQVRITEYEFTAPNGDQKWISWTTTPIINADGHLAGISAVGTDITPQKESEIKEKAYIQNLEFISRSAMNFANLPHNDGIYDYISSELISLLHEGVAVVTAFDENPGTLTIKSIKGEIEGYEDMLSSMLNQKVLDKKFKIPGDYRKLLNTNGIIHMSGGLYDLFMKNFSEDVCTMINEVLDLYECYMIGISRDNRLFGSIAFVVPHRIGEDIKSIIEIFVNQASVSLQRCWYEEELARYAAKNPIECGNRTESDTSPNNLRRIIEAIKNDHVIHLRRQNGIFSTVCESNPDCPVFTIDKKGIITRANSTLVDIVGNGRPIIGRDIMAFIPHLSQGEVMDLRENMASNSDKVALKVSVPLISESGAMVPVTWKLDKMFDKNGEVSNILWIGSRSVQR